MVVMMASPNSSELRDYEVIFKRHIHDNLLLNSDLRLLDEMKKSKLKEFKRTRDQFKIRFSKFNKPDSIRSVSDGRFTRNSTPRASKKPSFLVCKTSPCSLKTWSNLTDLTKEKVDVYKTDVLQSEEAVVSFRKKEENNSHGEKYAAGRKISSALLPDRSPRESPLFRSKSTLTKLHDVSDRETGDKQEAEVEFQLPDFRQRSTTMPSYCYKTRRPFSVKTIDTMSVKKLSCKNKETKGTEIICKDDNNTKDLKADENENRYNKSNPNVFVTHHGPDNIAKSEENVSKVTFDLSQNNIPHDDDLKQKAFPKFDRKFQRAKSVFIPSNKLSPQMFRRRSYTLDSTLSMKTVRGKILLKRESMDKFGMASRKLSLFDKLLGESMSSGDGDSDTEWSKCYEDLEACRYLRVPGQSIDGSREDLSLENVTFGQDSD